MLGLFPPGVGMIQLSHSPTVTLPSGPKDALPGDLQVVPVHAAPPAEDTLLYSYKNCPTLSDMTKQVRQRYDSPVPFCLAPPPQQIILKL